MACLGCLILFKSRQSKAERSICVSFDVRDEHVIGAVVVLTYLYIEHK